MAEKRILTEDELDCVTGGANAAVRSEWSDWVADGNGLAAKEMRWRDWLVVGEIDKNSSIHVYG